LEEGKPASINPPLSQHQVQNHQL